MKLFFIFTLFFSLPLHLTYAQSDSTHVNRLIEERLQLMVEKINQSNLVSVAEFYTSDSSMIGRKTLVEGEAISSYWPKFKGVERWELQSLSVDVL